MTTPDVFFVPTSQEQVGIQNCLRWSPKVIDGLKHVTAWRKIILDISPIWHWLGSGPRVMGGTWVSRFAVHSLKAAFVHWLVTFLRICCARLWKQAYGAPAKLLRASRRYQRRGSALRR